MESPEVNKDSPNNMIVKRRSIKAKNLEEEVELILSQDESDDHTGIELPQTPSTSGVSQQMGRVKVATTPRAMEMAALKELLQTPRRSCRKSVKPAQDYDDIVKRSMRSLGRSAKKSLMTFDEKENEENMECLKVDEDSQPKWTTSVVGKSSTKRGRKSKRNTTTAKGKKNKKDDEKKDDTIVMEDNSSSHRKLEWDFVVSKDINEEYSYKNVEHDQVIEAVQQEIPASSDEVEYDQVPLECAKEIVDHVEAVHKQPLQDVEVRIIPSIVIQSPPEENDEVKENRENKETPKEASVLCEKVKEQYQEEEKSNNNLDASEDIAKNEVSEEDNIIHLMQEDSEDIKDLQIGVKEQRETSVTEVNVTANVININVVDDKESSSDSFGSYLKSNKINVTDLGLIPLNDNDDDDVEVIGDYKSSTVAHISEAEEMPSLIILDDEEDEVTHNEEMVKDCSDKPKLDETFEAITEVKKENNHKQRSSFEAYEAVDNSLQSFLQNEAAAIVGDEEATEMDALKMSEDEETPRKPSRTVLTKNKTLSTPTISSKPSTPKHKAKPFSFPTPYRNRNVNREPTSSTKKLPLHHNNMSLALTTLEPREIVLRGIRKRSFSMCLGGGVEINNAPGGSANKRQRTFKGPLATLRQQKAVNFYSPANQTTTIDDLDKVIEGSVRKDKHGKLNQQITNVTTRRKRSFSFDESMMSKSLISKIPRAAGAVPVPSVSVSTTNASSSSSSSSSTSSVAKLARTKLPNFAAIHQKHFQKMENLVDHVARKQERSQILINSSTKIKSASAQKNVLRSEKCGHLEKPKALKKIDLEGTSQTKVKSLYNSLATKSITKAINTALTKSTTTKENNCMPEKSNLPHPRDLPHPRVFKYVNKHQEYLRNKQHLKPTQTLNVLVNTKSTTSTSLKKQQQPRQQQKPFNLSTQLATKPQVVKSKTTLTSTLPPTAVTSTYMAATTSISSTNVPSLPTQDKIASRLQRHMDLFKGRGPSARAGVASRKVDGNIRGVRSNRRFELQMQHRKNLEN